MSLLASQRVTVLILSHTWAVSASAVGRENKRSSKTKTLPSNWACHYHDAMNKKTTTTIMPAKGRGLPAPPPKTSSPQRDPSLHRVASFSLRSQLILHTYSSHDHSRRPGIKSTTSCWITPMHVLALWFLLEMSPLILDILSHNPGVSESVVGRENKRWRPRPIHRTEPVTTTKRRRWGRPGRPGKRQRRQRARACQYSQPQPATCADARSAARHEFRRGRRRLRPFIQPNLPPPQPKHEDDDEDNEPGKGQGATNAANLSQLPTQIFGPRPALWSWLITATQSYGSSETRSSNWSGSTASKEEPHRSTGSYGRLYALDRWWGRGSSGAGSKSGSTYLEYWGFRFKLLRKWSNSMHLKYWCLGFRPSSKSSSSFFSSISTLSPKLVWFVKIGSQTGTLKCRNDIQSH